MVCLQVSKLALNCLWGKLGQRDNMKKVVYFKEQGEFFNLLSNDAVQLKKIDSIGEKMVRVEYVNGDEFIEEQLNTNVIHAAYTTAFGRLHLYNCLDALGTRCLYFDTDSVFFTSPVEETQETIKTGDALGDLTNEIAPERSIVSFCSAGPKNYVYLLDNNTTSVTVKGITLNCRTKTVLTYDLVRSMILKAGPNQVAVMNNTFGRNPLIGALHMEPAAKTYRVVYTKRAVLEDGISTMPYGYRLQ